MPAVVGGGAGDVDGVLCAGRTLARAGFPLTLYRRAGEPLPVGVDGPWDWPPHRRVAQLLPRASRALTVAPSWGITCAPAVDGPFGRAGPWARETAEIEREYGRTRTAHLSLEEFARTLSSRQENLERFREGGVRSRELALRLARARRGGEVAAHLRAFRTFRAFDRANVLHVFATFRYDRRFAREFPEAVQVGPLWPGRGPPRRPVQRRGRAWVWYASPASAEAIAPDVIAGLGRIRPTPRLLIRSPRPWSADPTGGSGTLVAGPIPHSAWRHRFRAAAVRIVTGSRSLLEALEVGGPFLYFNGVVGTGAARRRHRPEKIVGFLDVARSARWPPDLVRDLGDFSRGRRVAEVVARAAGRNGGWRTFPVPPRPQGFAPGFEEAGKVLVRFARAFAAQHGSSEELVAETRHSSHP